MYGEKDMHQISVTLPDVLYKEGKKYAKEAGYRSIQEVITDTLRRKVLGKELEEYENISKEMREGKNVVKFKTQEEAIEFLEAI